MKKLDKRGKCTCKTCKTSRRFASIIENLKPKDKRWMEVFYDNYLDVSQDLELTEIMLKAQEKLHGKIPLGESLDMIKEEQ